MTKREAKRVLESDLDHTYNNESKEALRMAIKALEQEPKTDTWSIKDVADTLEKHGLIVEQEPCENAISRQTAIDAFERFIHELGIEDEPYNYGEMALSVKNVPPVTSQPKTGHWIKIKPYPLQMHEYECSECLHETDDPTDNYCSECGAKMV